MTNVLVDDTYLTDIADSIRSKLGVSDTYLPSEMAGAIDDIGGGVTPTGTINITTNGTHDVTQYASANVAVPGDTLGTKSITENGTYNASSDSLDGYSSVTVNVSGGGTKYKEGEITFDTAKTSATAITTISDIGFTPTLFVFFAKDVTQITGTANMVVSSYAHDAGNPTYGFKSTVKYGSGGTALTATNALNAFTASTNNGISNNNGTVQFNASSSYQLKAATYCWRAFE